MKTMNFLLIWPKSKFFIRSNLILKRFFSLLIPSLIMFFLSYYPCLAVQPLNQPATTQVQTNQSEEQNFGQENQENTKSQESQILQTVESQTQDKTQAQEKTTEQKTIETQQKTAEQETQQKSEEKTEAKPGEQESNQASPQPEKKKTLKDWLLPWKKTIELSYVVTGGNTVSSSFSLGNTLIRTPNEKDTYTIKTYFLRSHSTTITQKAVGTEDNYTIEEEKTRRLTAENYLISGQYDHRATGRLLTTLAFVWDRNKFSGVEGRALWTAGAGLVLADSLGSKVKTHAGVSFTIRKYTAQSLSSFLGFRYSFSWDQKLFDNAFFATSFIFDDNLAKISDWRYEWASSLTAPLSKSLALKTSLKIIRTHRPPEIQVPLFNPDGSETGLFVYVPRHKVDTFFTTTIVLNF